MFIRILFSLFVLPCFLWSANSTVPLQFFSDPPTLYCLAYRWIILGDDNRNATVTVKFREVGTSTWLVGIPALRNKGDVINKDYDPYTTGNLFAGSVLGLKPATSYEVQITLTDPDGGSTDTTLTLSTLDIPPSYQSSNVVHVNPPASNFTAAIASATPGTILLIHKGTYTGNYVIGITATKTQPVVIRGAGDGEAIFDGNNYTGRIFDIQGSHYIHFENVSIRNGNTAIKANGVNGLMVRNCKITDVNWGIMAYTETQNWYIADNTITGRVSVWYPRSDALVNHPDETGILIAGIQQMVYHNTVSNFWDGIDVSNDIGKPPSVAAPTTMVIDYWGNDVANCADDGFEIDFSVHNVRVWENRFVNGESGISTQPFYGGPAYIYRNFLYNMRQPLKMNNWPSGLEIYNNTFVGHGQALDCDPIWQNTIMKNNLFLCGDRYTIESGSPDPATFLDYNGYFETPDVTRFIKWTVDNWVTFSKYMSLAEFTTGTGYEAHGIMVTYSDLVDLTAPLAGITYPVNILDYRLKASAAPVDKGTVIPVISSQYKGAAPDMGCLEEGDAIPAYGVRPTIPVSLQHRVALTHSIPLVSVSPNPFNLHAQIGIEMVQAGSVALEIVDQKGSAIGKLMLPDLAAGYHRIPWQATDLPAGIYFLKINTQAGQRAYKRMLIIK